MADVVTIQTARGPFTVARQHADRFKSFLDDPEWGDYSIDATQSGGYNPRNIRGTNTPSQHAFGNALDLNWSRNARGTKGDINPELARRLAQKHGLTWGGDWSNPDPMHFEVARTPGATPLAGRSMTAFAGLKPPETDSAVAGSTTQRPPMATTYMPQSGVAPQSFDGLTPEMVEEKRRMAQQLYGKATSAAPLQHWTQALAQGVQGLSSGMARSQADQGEREGKQSLAAVLAQGGSPQDRMTALAANPWGADIGQKLMAGQLQSQLEADSPMGRINLETAGYKRDAMKRDLEQPKFESVTIPEGGLHVIKDRAGNVVRTLSGNPKEKESALDKKVASEQVEIAVKYIQAGDAARDMMNPIAELKQISQDPNLVSAIGPVMGDSRYQSTIGRLPFAAGNPELNAKINRLQQALSLGGTQAFLKGLGSASDAEGRRVEQAVSNLTTSRTKQEFDSNLRIIEQGLQNQLKRASAARQRFPQLDVAGYGQPQPTGAPQAAPGAAPAAPKPGNRQFGSLPRSDQRTAIMQLAKDQSPETLANFEAEFGTDALNTALQAANKLKQGMAF